MADSITGARSDVVGSRRLITRTVGHPPSPRYSLSLAAECSPELTGRSDRGPFIKKKQVCVFSRRGKETRVQRGKETLSDWVNCLPCPGDNSPTLSQQDS